MEDLCEEAMDDNLTSNQATGAPNKKKRTISLEIRVTLVQAIRCIRHYSLHLGGFKADMADLVRITYHEDRDEITIDEEE